MTAKLSDSIYAAALEAARASLSAGESTATAYMAAYEAAREAGASEDRAQADGLDAVREAEGENETESEPTAADLGEMDAEVLDVLADLAQGEEDGEDNGRGWDVFAGFALEGCEDERTARRDRKRDRRAARRVSRALAWMED